MAETAPTPTPYEALLPEHRDAIPAMAAHEASYGAVDRALAFRLSAVVSKQFVADFGLLAMLRELHCFMVRPEKHWTPAHFKRLEQAVAQFGVRAVHLGTHMEDRDALRILDWCAELVAAEWALTLYDKIVHGGLTHKKIAGAFGLGLCARKPVVYYYASSPHFWFPSEGLVRAIEGDGARPRMPHITNGIARIPGDQIVYHLAGLVTGETGLANVAPLWKGDRTLEANLVAAKDLCTLLLARHPMPLRSADRTPTEAILAVEAYHQRCVARATRKEDRCGAKRSAPPLPDTVALPPAKVPRLLEGAEVNRLVDLWQRTPHAIPACLRKMLKGPMQTRDRGRLACVALGARVLTVQDMKALARVALERRYQEEGNRSEREVDMALTVFDERARTKPGEYSAVGCRSQLKLGLCPYQPVEHFSKKDGRPFEVPDVEECLNACTKCSDGDSPLPPPPGLARLVSQASSDPELARAGRSRSGAASRGFTPRIGKEFIKTPAQVLEVALAARA